MHLYSPYNSSKQVTSAFTSHDIRLSWNFSTKVHALQPLPSADPNPRDATNLWTWSRSRFLSLSNSYQGRYFIINGSAWMYVQEARSVLCTSISRVGSSSFTCGKVGSFLAHVPPLLHTRDLVRHRPHTWIRHAYAGHACFINNGGRWREPYSWKVASKATYKFRTMWRYYSLSPFFLVYPLLSYFESGNISDSRRSIRLEWRSGIRLRVFASLNSRLNLL